MKEGRREVRKTKVEWCIYRESDELREGRERVLLICNKCGRRLVGT